VRLCGERSGDSYIHSCGPEFTKNFLDKLEHFPTTAEHQIPTGRTEGSQALVTVVEAIRSDPATSVVLLLAAQSLVEGYGDATVVAAALSRLHEILGSP
jgi:hypothetical protein